MNHWHPPHPTPTPQILLSKFHFDYYASAMWKQDQNNQVLCLTVWQ